VNVSVVIVGAVSRVRRALPAVDKIAKPTYPNGLIGEICPQFVSRAEIDGIFGKAGNRKSIHWR
jgi:hypothetical protein